MDSRTTILNGMKTIGFSEYESKAYLQLLEEYPLNGYTLSKHSGIPRSRIYEVLKNLLDKQMVFEETDGKNTLYYPVEPEIFIKRIQSHYQELFSSISSFTEKIYQETTQEEKLVVIKGRKNIFNFVNLLIRGAEQRLAMSIWEEDIEELLPEINKAIDRGVVLRGIYFGENLPYDTLVAHRRLKRYIAEKKARYISIIIDRTHTLSGIVSRGNESKVTWTRDEGFIEISEDYIAHDLLVNLYSASLNKKGYSEFEEFVDNVHHNFFHYTEEEFLTYKKLR